MTCSSKSSAVGQFPRALVVVLMAGMIICGAGLPVCAQRGPVVVAEIKGPIGVGTGYYIKDALAFAGNENAQLVV